MKNYVLLLIAFGFLSTSTMLAADPPLVYSVENTGASFAPPVMPTFANCPVVEQLPDPYKWTDGSGRDETFEAWAHHRNDIKLMIENYEIGEKPVVTMDQITASYSESNNTLTVTVTVEGRTLTMTSAITFPDTGTGPFPIYIGMNGGGNIGSQTSKGIASMPFTTSQVSNYGSQSSSHPFYQLYPHINVTNHGQYSAWSWGVSRLIDGLYKLNGVVGSRTIDLNRIMVSGCSYAGKMALFAGAFDERIALTIAQESGGGGAAAWRVSQTLGPVENLGATDHKWFSESMFVFSGDRNVPKLPIDHHQLVAMCLPRALLVIGNPGQTWLADESGYVSCRAAESIYDNFGISDRFGFSMVGGHSHCDATSVTADVNAFINKFILGNTTVNTNIRKHAAAYTYTDYNRWFKWWGTDDSDLEDPDVSEYDFYFLEAECGNVGASFTIHEDATCSNGKYIRVPDTQQNNLGSAPTDVGYHVSLPVTIDEAGTYILFARLLCPTADDDSFFVRMDNGSWEMLNGLNTGDGLWMWKMMKSFNNLTAGNHVLTIAARENGANIDQVTLTNSPYVPTFLGNAINCAEGGVLSPDLEGYSLKVNPTTVSFEIPVNLYVSLKVYDITGVEIAELAGTDYLQGQYELPFPGDLPKGTYICTLRAGDFVTSKKIVK